MLWLLVQKEIKGNLLSLRFLLAFLVVVVVVAGSLHIRLDDYEQSALDYQANLTGAREELRDSSWWRFQWTGIFVERPIQPLSVLASGIERDPEARYRVFEKARPLIRPAGSIDRDPLTTLTCPVDVMFIVGIVMSLLVLVLSFDSISGERELGTLKLLLSFPVPRSKLLFAKWLGGVITLSIPFVICYLGVAIWILLSPIIRFGGTDWLAFLLIGIASLLYISWMFSAALLVSCWFRSSASSMCMLLVLWVLTVLVVPNVTPYIAAGMVPAESVQSIRFKSMKIAKELQDQENKGLDEIARKYKVDRWWQNEKSWPEGVDFVTEIHNKQRQATRAVVDGREAKIAEQTVLAHALGRCSPFAAYAYIVATLAWTGPDFGPHFRTVVQEYEDRLRQLSTQGLRDRDTFEPERIPYFQYKPPPVARRFMLALMDWIVLGSGTVVFFLAAYVSFVTREVIE
jgi:ABC-type transport system involved in multi-copper enzyme maturation permease subunit